MSNEKPKERAREWVDRWDVTICEQKRIGLTLLPEDTKDVYEILSGILSALESAEQQVESQINLLKLNTLCLENSGDMETEILALREENKRLMNAEKAHQTACHEIDQLIYGLDIKNQDIDKLKARVAELIVARAQANDRIVELEKENERLNRALMEIMARSKGGRLKRQIEREE